MSVETKNQNAQLQCLSKGGPFRIVDVPKPIPEPNQVLIRQSAVALNDLDRKQRDWGVMVTEWPHVLGLEGAGVVEAVGSDVSDFQPGDEVFAWGPGRAHGENWGGTFQKYVVIPAPFVAKKPSNISIEESASLSICYNTAVIAILACLQIPLPFIPGTKASGSTPVSILILGGSSSTGAAAIQLLRLVYPSLPILATSSEKHHARLASLGATKLVDYRLPTAVSDIKSASPNGEGVDMIIDCVGAGFYQTDICNAFNPAGAKKYAAVVTGVDIKVPDGVTKISVSGEAIFHVQGGMHIIPALTKLVEEGKYKVPLPINIVGHGLDKISAALDTLPTVSGQKLIVTV